VFFDLRDYKPYQGHDYANIGNQGLQYQWGNRNNDYIFEGSFPGYEWVDAYYEFKGTVHHPFHFDVVLVNVPAKKGPGHYIVWYNFGGYYDCIDVDITNDPVDNIVGSNLDADGQQRYKWSRMDHCLFVEPEVTHTCFAIVDDPAECMAECDSLGLDVCSGVNVVPVTNDPAVLFPDDVQIPWAVGQSCSGNKAELEAAEGQFVCYGVKPRNTEGNTRSEYEVSQDMLDARFYSTCFAKTIDTGCDSSGLFLVVCHPSSTPPLISLCSSLGTSMVMEAETPRWYWNGDCIP
jgi:hypothetical protein